MPFKLTNDRYALDSEPFIVNMHVTFPTTPAQYFHLLRRQMKRNYRKPLVVAAPKGLLRLAVSLQPMDEAQYERPYQAAASSLKDLGPETRFQPVLRDPEWCNAWTNNTTPKRVVLLSGKIYYDLVKERSQRKLEDQVALVRIEELSPFPFAELEEVLDELRAGSVSEFCYLQEEPRNQGAWGHVKERLEGVLPSGTVVKYLGRKESAVPAPGIGELYQAQQRRIIDSCFEGL